MILSDRFPRYTQYDPKIPVWCVTPHEGRIIHRFFDTSPFSPSGRYMALFRMPFEDRRPLPGEAGQIVLVDLHEGTETVVAETCGWESQVGSNVQWGSTDNELYYNDVLTDSWTPVGVKLNPFTGVKRHLDSGIFVISPDGRSAATTCPMRARRTQHGYGVMVPDELLPRNSGLPADDGLYITDTETGKSRLFVSILDMLEALRSELDLDMYRQGETYGFQCRWNPQGTRLLILLRWLRKEGGERKHAITLNDDGTDIRLAIHPDEYDKGGHHINWCPDGEHLTMNLKLHRKELRFVKFRYDGSGLQELGVNNLGSGHPTAHPNGTHLLTDSYQNDVPVFGDGTIPIRWIDVRDGSETDLIRIFTKQNYENSLRVDPHPAWDRTYTRFAFNAFADGTRRVYVADMSALL
jgi:hypothetical protein